MSALIVVLILALAIAAYFFLGTTTTPVPVIVEEDEDDDEEDDEEVTPAPGGSSGVSSTGGSCNQPSTGTTNRYTNYIINANGQCVKDSCVDGYYDNEEGECFREGLRCTENTGTDPNVDDSTYFNMGTCKTLNSSCTLPNVDNGSAQMKLISSDNTSLAYCDLTSCVDGPEALKEINGKKY